MNDSAAVIVGASISALVAVGVVAFQFFLERSRQAQADRAARLHHFLASSFTVGTAIGQIAMADTHTKAQVEASMRSAHEDSLNQHFASLRLQEGTDVVEAATNIERELTRLTRIANSQKWQPTEWRPQRATLSSLTHDFESIARRRLGGKPLTAELTFYSSAHEHATS